VQRETQQTQPSSHPEKDPRMPIIEIMMTTVIIIIMTQYVAS
jgi:hypothetical protein